MTSEYTFPNPFVPEKRRMMPSKRVWIILGVIGAILLLLLGALAAYIRFDVLKSPKLIYLQSEMTTMQEMKTEWSGLWASLQKEGVLASSQPIHTVLELSEVQVEPGDSSPIPSNILDLIAKSQLVIDNQQDAVNHKVAETIDWLVDDKPFVGVESAFDPEKVIFRVPALYEKYGYIDVKDVDAFKKRFQTDAFPKRVVSPHDWVDAMSIQSDELTHLLLPYGKLLAGEISPSRIKLNSDAHLSEAGTSVKCRELVLTFSQEDVSRMMGEIADKLAADKDMQDAVYKRMLGVRLLASDSGYPVKYVEKEAFLKQWGQFASELKRDAANSDLRDGLTMKVYIDRQHRILQRKLEFAMKDASGSSATTIKMGSWNASKSSKYSLLSIVTDKDKGIKEELTFLHSRDMADARVQGKVALSANKKGTEQDDYAFSAQVAYDTKKLADKESGSYHFKVSLPDHGETEGAVYEGDVTAEMTKSGNVTDTNSRVNLSLRNDASTEVFHKLNFKLHASRELGAEVKMPLLSDDNSLNLGQMSDKDMADLYMEIGQGMQSFIRSNKDLLQLLGFPAGLLGDPGDPGGDQTSRAERRLST